MSNTATTVPVGTWNVDPVHSSVEFRVKHLGIATVKGRFDEFAGQLVIDADGTNRATGTVKVASVDTNEPKRDDHLRSADFFDAETFPDIAFAATDVEVNGDEIAVRGDLTIHGVTNPIVLSGELGGVEQDPWGNQRVGLEVRGELNRRDYGMTFDQAAGGGNLLVGNVIKLELEVSAVKAA